MRDPFDSYWHVRRFFPCLILIPLIPSIDIQSIEQLKKEGATWGKKSRWANIKSVFGSPFSLKWFSPFHTPNMQMGKLEPYQYCV